ncbi:MAG: hypothetical protein DDG60_06050 [Anaerolineae bacterium]|nr:MAG: hypothetical protein DDG60_06050 [Anaerolineae bacterium]
MKRRFLLVSVLLLLFSYIPPRWVAAESVLLPETNSGAVLCAPGVYPESFGDCVPLGPSVTLTRMAQLGLEYPPRSLPALKPDPSLNVLPYRYYKVDNTTGTGFYPSLEAAIERRGATRILPPGRLLYVVYTSRIDTERQGTYFLLPSGNYMPGDGSTAQVASSFQGLEFQATPRNAFGWVIHPSGAPVYAQPGRFRPALRTLARFDVVQVYSRQNIEGVEWVLIGPDEWVEDRLIGVVQPKAIPPQGVTNDRWIEVNLAEQTLAVYDAKRLVFATLVTTGVEPFYTRPGLFPIYKKLETENMQGAFEADRSDFYYLENVPWTMYFDKARALHGAYWGTMFGYPASHGCVNLSVGDAKWLFLWAKEGDWVWVHDPSGQTPTDPSFYGDGGA